MKNKEIDRVATLFISIGKKLKEDESFLESLESFLKGEDKSGNRFEIDVEKIDRLDLFQLIREKGEEEVQRTLSTFNIKELREVLKKYRFGSPSKLKSELQIKDYIQNQLRQRKTDVFQSPKTEGPIPQEKLDA